MRLILFAILWLFATTFAVSDVVADEPEPVDFERDVVPLFERSCFRCHGGKEPHGTYRFDLKSVLLGEHEDSEYPFVEPGDRAASRLFEVMSGADPDIVMPPEDEPEPRLTASEVEVFGRWIDAGMPWRDDLLPEEDADHWAFDVITRPSVPGSADDRWSANPVDAFVSEKHREEGLQPAETADRRTLIRRLYRDMLGVPPTFEEARAFIADTRPDAWERLVDRVMASPKYGERWGRHWLDVARYAESDGYEQNNHRPSMYRYRDYVVRSFNEDRPFDEFTRQQISGDEMQPRLRENLVATGFLATGRVSVNQEDPWFQRNNVNIDIVGAVANSFLGLTMECCQCHDHKFDPVLASDFYRLQAFFVRGQPTAVRLPEEPGSDFDVDEFRSLRERKQEIYQKYRKEYRWGRLADRFPPEDQDRLKALMEMPCDERTLEQEKVARIVEVQITHDVGSYESIIKGDIRKEYDELKKQIAEMEKTLDRGLVYYSPVTSPYTLDTLKTIGDVPFPLPFDPQYFERMQPYVMTRGEVHKIGEPVKPGWPAVFEESGEQDSSTAERTRSDLAGWLTDRNNPLVARVWSNRIWYYHFGRGLAASVSDFGFRGARPTHQNLLDWLASDLMDYGWSSKHLHRLILTSRTYQLASIAAPETASQDKDNLSLTRWTPRRMEMEVVRDAVLAVSGELDARMGGPSEGLSKDDVMIRELEAGKTDYRELNRRRSVYLFQRRGMPAEMQALFDGPNECSFSRGVREISTTPLQALYLLNADFSLRAARTLVEEIQQASGGRPDQWISEAFRRILQREPNEQELQASLELLKVLRNAPADEVEDDAHDADEDDDEDESEPPPPPSPLVLLCQTLLNLNEFAYLE